MLYALEGKVEGKRDVHIFLNVNGLIFDVLVPPAFSEELKLGMACKVYVNLIITEDNVLLYGFKTPDEREVFAELIKLQGIGPSIVFRIMSAMGIDELLSCLEHGDINKLSQIKGVGAKRAERILFETKGLSVLARTHTEDQSLKTRAVSALVSLGLKENEASNLVNSVLRKYSDVKSVEDVVRLALGGNLEDN